MAPIALDGEPDDGFPATPGVVRRGLVGVDSDVVARPTARGHSVLGNAHDECLAAEHRPPGSAPRRRGRAWNGLTHCMGFVRSRVRLSRIKGFLPHLERPRYPLMYTVIYSLTSQVEGIIVKTPIYQHFPTFRTNFELWGSGVKKPMDICPKKYPI